MATTPSLITAKFKALAAHLSISAVLVAAAFGLVLLRWFPSPFFITDGAGDGLKLVVLVDMVLGPLLTFVVFNPAKRRRELALDLGLIGAAQLAAMLAGLISIYCVRIQAVAFDKGGFQTVAAAVFKGQTISAKDWAALGPNEPYLVDVREPANGEEQSGVMAFAFIGGLSPYQVQFLYRPFAPQLAARSWAAYTAAEMAAQAPELAKATQLWLGRHSTLSAERLRFFPVQGYSRSAVLVFNDQGLWLGGFAGSLKAKNNPQPEAAPAPATSPSSG